MPNGWEALVGELQNKYDAKTSQYKIKGVTKMAGIYGLDGTCFAQHGDFSLTKYKFEVDQEDGSKKTVDVNEVNCAIAAAKGDRSGGSGGAGIRMAGSKFVLLRPSPEVDKGAYLSRQGGGGATVVLTEKCVIVAVWDKDAVMSNKQNQNTFDCTDLVERMSKFLKKQGF